MAVQQTAEPQGISHLALVRRGTLGDSWLRVVAIKIAKELELESYDADIVSNGPGSLSLVFGTRKPGLERTRCIVARIAAGNPVARGAMGKMDIEYKVTPDVRWVSLKLT